MLWCFIVFLIQKQLDLRTCLKASNWHLILPNVNLIWRWRQETERLRVGGKKVSFLTKWEKSLLQILTHLYLYHLLNAQFLWQWKYLSLRWCFHFFTEWYREPHLNVTAKSKIFTLLWNEDLKYELNVTSTSRHDSNNIALSKTLFHPAKINKIWKNMANIYISCLSV